MPPSRVNDGRVQATIKARAKSVPAGAFITSMGGWNPAQFMEKRLPTLAELDAATSEHAVLVFQGFTGPAATNTRGKAFFAGKGIVVSDTGAIGATGRRREAVRGADPR
jgi:predicted amidohydrolase YtcJ